MSTFSTTSFELQQDLIGFPELFERSVNQWPDADAIVSDGTVLSYAELNAYANRIAHLLLQDGIAPETCIGLCLDRSHHAIAAMLGVLKAGAAFVPLDPEFPAERLSYMVQDAEISKIICATPYRDLYPQDGSIEIIDPVGDVEQITNVADPEVEICPERLAYVMYTSGSTGNPKGVQIEHRSLAAYCFADIDVYDVVAEDRTLQFSTLNFDIAIEEIFPPLLVGSCVVVRPSERSSHQNELSAIIESKRVTAVHIATAYWHEWVDLMRASGEKVPESIRLMVVTGEKVSAEHVRRWHELCDHEVLWCNAYGPTEATVSATVFTPPKGWVGDNMPIGKPLKRYTGHILSPNDAGELVPVDEGETGELYIGGPALARGYLNRPDLTKAAFVSVSVGGVPTRLYKSGDLARWLPNGDIEFAGRIDHQIKLGSYRIEPGEIEAAINTHDDVLESLVSYEEIDGRKFLIAYVARGVYLLESHEVAEYLRDQLPPYMIPTRYVMLACFPKTINGKVDRRALPSPKTSEVARFGECDLPESELQTDLVAIWEKVLNVPAVGIHDDFFALGGSSLLVTSVIMQIQSRLDFPMPVRDFFANPTIASLAAHIERMQSGETNADDDADANVASEALRNKLPVIEPAYIPSGEHRLFGVHYFPVDSATQLNESSGQAVLICQPYGHEYQRSYRNLQQLAVLLAQSNIHVLRFDYAGTGNSTGTTAEGGVDQWRNDIRAAAEHLKRVSGTEKISVVCLRFGGTLATESGLEGIEQFILWDPIDGQKMCAQLDGLHEYTLRDFHRYNRAYRKAQPNQLYGFALSPAQRRSIESLRLASVASAPVAVITSRDTELPESYSAWNHISTQDEIHWDQPQKAECAFASPVAFQSIVNILTKTRD